MYDVHNSSRYYHSSHLLWTLFSFSFFGKQTQPIMQLQINIHIFINSWKFTKILLRKFAKFSLRHNYYYYILQMLANVFFFEHIYLEDK